MTVALSLLTTLMSWAAMGADKAAEKANVPGIFKVLLPVMLVVALLTVIAIAVLAIGELLKKKVPLIDESTEHGSLASSEMTRYEAESKTRPILGKVGAALFLIAVGAFFFLGLYTMGRGSSTTAQLRKEGREKTRRSKAAQMGISTSLEVGEDVEKDKGSSGGFGSGIDGMKSGIDGMKKE